MLHILIFCFCFLIFAQSINTEQLHKSNCSYGTLSHGVAAWGLDMDGKQISGSSTVVHSGPESIEAFNILIYNFSAFVTCFAPFARNGKQQTTCHYGPLANGLIAWGLTSGDKPVSGTTTLARSGSAGINAFTHIFDDFSTVTRICFQPLVQ